MENAHGISDYSWNLARYAISENFTKPIGHKLLEVTKLASNIDSIIAYDYAFVTWADFISDPRKPDGLFERALPWRNDHEEAFVYAIFDPLDDENGFLLVGPNAQALADEAREYIIDMLPNEGPLSVDKIAMGMVEATQ